MLGVLGTLPFVCSQDVVLTFKDLTVDRSVRWAKHDVIGKKPVLEWIGEELASVSFTMRFDTSLGVPPIAGLLALKKMMESRKDHILIIGGEFLGRFVIESISETRKFHTGVGVCQVAEAQITLTEWAGGASLADTIKGAFG